MTALYSIFVYCHGSNLCQISLKNTHLDWIVSHFSVLNDCWKYCRKIFQLCLFGTIFSPQTTSKARSLRDIVTFRVPFYRTNYAGLESFSQMFRIFITVSVMLDFNVTRENCIRLCKHSKTHCHLHVIHVIVFIDYLIVSIVNTKEQYN